MFNPFKRNDYRNRYTKRPSPFVPRPEDAPHITGRLPKTLKYIKETAGESDDFSIRHTQILSRQAAMLYYSTITDTKSIEDVLHSIQRHVFPHSISNKDLPFYLEEHVISSRSITFVHNLWEVREGLSRGEFVLLIDGLAVAISIGVTSVEHRKPEPPTLESSTRGPQIAFVENVEINIGLMRKAFGSDALTVKTLTVGYRSRTQIAVAYEHDVANPLLVDTVIKRIRAVHVDKLTGSATLEQRIVDNHWTIFPQTRATTRVDNCVKEVGQGKVLIIVDGDPSAMLVPGTVVDFYQTMEDDQHNYIEASLVRLLRYISFMLAVYLPALYIAFSDYNPELIPPVLALQVARSREGVPFSAAFEVMIMQLVIEIIREATLRMPTVMGQTLGIVGGLVLGQAAVAAGLVSNILIVVIALAAVSIFVMPSYEWASTLRILIWFNILWASALGFYGIVLGTMLILFHLSSLKTFGLSYLTPMDGEHWMDFFLDGITRAPLPMLDRRAAHLHQQESYRSSDYTDPVRRPMLENPKKP